MVPKKSSPGVGRGLAEVFRQWFRVADNVHFSMSTLGGVLQQIRLSELRICFCTCTVKYRTVLLDCKEFSSLPVAHVRDWWSLRHLGKVLAATEGVVQLRTTGQFNKCG
jgi:hypothetical protein